MGVNNIECQTVFVKRNNRRDTIVVVYVNDIVEMKGLSQGVQNQRQENCNTPWEYKLPRSKKGIVVSQCKNTLDLFEETGKLGAKPVDTPIQQNHGLCSESNDLLHNWSAYETLVGKLIYFTLICCKDHESIHTSFKN